MYFCERLEPKRYEVDSSNDPPLGPESFSKSICRSTARLLNAVKLCRLPPVGFPRASVTNVKVGVMPWSSSQLRMPYQSPSRCSVGRISWKGVSAKERV